MRQVILCEHTSTQGFDYTKNKGRKTINIQLKIIRIYKYNYNPR